MMLVIAAEIEEAGRNFGLANLLLRRGIEVRIIVVLLRCLFADESNRTKSIYAVCSRLC